MSEPVAYALSRSSADFFALLRDKGLAAANIRPLSPNAPRAFAWLALESAGVNQNPHQARIVRWSSAGSRYDLSGSNQAYAYAPCANSAFGPIYGNDGTNYPLHYFGELIGYGTSGGAAGKPIFLVVDTRSISHMSLGMTSSTIEHGLSVSTGDILWFDQNCWQWVRLPIGSVGQVLTVCQEGAGGPIRPAWRTPPASIASTTIGAYTRVAPPALPAGASWPADPAGPEPAPYYDAPSAGASSPSSSSAATSPTGFSHWPPTLGSVIVTVKNAAGVPQAGRYVTVAGVYYTTNIFGQFEFGWLTPGSVSILLTTLGGGETSAWSTNDLDAAGSSPTGSGFTATATIAADMISSTTFTVT